MPDLNTIYNLITIFLYSVFFTFVAIEYFKKKSLKYGYVVEDKYKRDKRKLPTMGGIPMFVGVMAALSLTQLLIKNGIAGKLFIFYFIVTAYTLYGVVDDLFHFRRRYDKILILLVLSLPIASLISHSSINIAGHELNLDGFYPFLVAPLFIMVAANLVNVYSGFNGLATGLTLIMFILAGIKSYMLYGTENLIYLLPCLGALLVFFYYNIFPARMHEGNAGAFMIGSCLGAFLIVNKLEFFGFVMLIPHIVNFIMDTVVLAILKIPDEKFGRVRRDGTIEAPKSVRFKSLKFMLTYYFRLTEPKAVWLLYLPTLIFGLAGVIWL
jgi:UDP-N-acetylglucosamine--dolichyl-phosphate N-acetylglucosaminephosphotransferase